MPSPPYWHCAWRGEKQLFEFWDLPRNKRHNTNKVLHLGWISMSPFPDEAINRKMPHFGGSVLSLLWAGKWETECLSGSIAISASSSNCMIGIFRSGPRAPIIAPFISRFKSRCASRSVHLRQNNKHSSGEHVQTRRHQCQPGKSHILTRIVA